MKNRRFIVGIVVGLIMAMSLQVFGAPTIEKITAYINHEFEFEFDGVRKAVPEGYHVLVYEGRSYVPAKFVAESLGATVEWNEATKVIGIKSPEPVIVTVPAVETTAPAVDTEEPKPVDTSYDYKALPQTRDMNGYRISALAYFSETQNIGDRLILSITNTVSDTVKLDQIKTKIIADGQEYTLSGKDATNFDTRWYAGIEKDQTTEGYLRLPTQFKDIDVLRIELTVDVTRDHKAATETVSFDIKL